MTQGTSLALTTSFPPLSLNPWFQLYLDDLRTQNIKWEILDMNNSVSGSVLS